MKPITSISIDCNDKMDDDLVITMTTKHPEHVPTMTRYLAEMIKEISDNHDDIRSAIIEDRKG